MEIEILKRLDAVKVTVPELVLPHNRNVSFTLANAQQLTEESQIKYDQLNFGQ